MTIKHEKPGSLVHFIRRKPLDASLRNTGDYFLKVNNGSTGKKEQNPQTITNLQLVCGIISPMRFKNEYVKTGIHTVICPKKAELWKTHFEIPSDIYPPWT